MTSWSYRLGATLLAASIGGCASQTPEETKSRGFTIGEPRRPVEPEESAETQAEHKRLLIQSMYLTAVGYFDRGEYDTALSELLRVVELAPRHAPAHFKISLIWYKKERYNEEINSLIRAIDADSDYLEAHLNLAHAYLAQEQLELALKHYREVLRLDPRHPLAHYNAGLINIDLNRWLIALEHLERAQENQQLLGPAPQEKIQVYVQRCKTRLGK